jgi:hypothetical protein
LLYIEDFAGGTYPEDLSIIDQYARAFERLRAAVLSPDESRELIAMLSAPAAAASAVKGPLTRIQG